MKLNRTLEYPKQKETRELTCTDSSYAGHEEILPIGSIWVAEYYDPYFREWVVFAKNINLTEVTQNLIYEMGKWLDSVKFRIRTSREVRM